MRQSVSLLIVLCLLASAGLSAQSRTRFTPQKKQPERTEFPMLDLSFYMGIPVNQFADNTDALGFGAKGSFYMPFGPKTPLYFGIGFGGMIFGSNSKQINEELVISSGSTVIGTIPVNLEARTNNWMLNGLLSLRYKAPFEYVQPYLEVTGGGSYLYTRTVLYDRSDRGIFTSDENDVINSRTLESSFTYNYGGGGGFLIRLGEPVYLNVGVTYLRGGRAKYFDKDQTSQWDIQFTGSGNFDPNNVQSDDVTLDYAGEPKKSTTDMIQVNLGVTFQFQ
ncbi:MAG: hypothetical protein R2791_06635 [Saprospiraceae bacterium]